MPHQEDRPKHDLAPLRRKDNVFCPPLNPPRLSSIEKKRSLSVLQLDAICQFQPSPSREILKKKPKITMKELLTDISESSPSKPSKCLQSEKENRLEKPIPNNHTPAKDNKSSSRRNITPQGSLINLADQCRSNTPLESPGRAVSPLTKLTNQLHPTIFQTHNSISSPLYRSKLQTEKILAPLDLTSIKFVPVTPTNPRQKACEDLYSLSKATLCPIMAEKPAFQLIPPLPLSGSGSKLKYPKAQVSPRKKICTTGTLASRAKILVERDKTGHRMWQSDMEASVVPIQPYKSLKVITVTREYGFQIAECTEEAEGIRWHVLLSGRDCLPGEDLKAYRPWWQIAQSILIISRYT